MKATKLKEEPPDQAEFDGLVHAASARLKDAGLSALSPESRFSLAYDAAHSLSLAALRWHGFRPSDRYIVFQVLGDTVEFPNAKWRFLDNCHQKRNAALYEGDFAGDAQLITELISVTHDLLAAVSQLPRLVNQSNA